VPLTLFGGMGVKKLSVVVLVAIIACSVAGRAAAQDTTGTIAGRMVDTQGLAMPGVTVTATGSQGAKADVTDRNGRFTVPFLTPGPYRVQAELPVFTSIDRFDVQVRNTPPALAFIGRGVLDAALGGAAVGVVVA
jgi:Carboxypeptidase regulatory-like domain